MNFSSLFFVRNPRSFWLLFITITTFLYLLVEFSFNSRLLDVVGGIAAADEVELIEKNGRLISGFAAVLVFCPFILKKQNMDILTKMAILLFGSMLLMSIVYLAEKWLIDSIVDKSKPQARYVAANLVALQRSLITQDAVLDDLALSKSQLARPDGKAFLAIFPLLAFSTEDIDRKIKDKKPEILRRNIDRSFGGGSENYNRYIDSVTAIKNIYNNSYMPGSNSYNIAINSIQQEQEKAWSAYVSRLRRNRLSPGSVPARYWGKVRDDVHGNGVPVSNNWRPSDRAGFYLAIDKKVRDTAAGKFRDGVGRMFAQGANLKPGLLFPKFTSSESVQNHWREKLKYPNGVRVRHDISDAPVYFREIYNPMLDIKVREQMKQYDAPVDQFADGAKLESFGKQGMRALVVPPIALAISLLGAIVHIFKFAFFSIQLASGVTFRHEWMKWSVILLGAILAFVGLNRFLSSEVTKQPLYGYFAESTSRMGGKDPVLLGKIASYAICGTIQGQTVAYPAFEWVRKNVLMGATFGYKGAD